ncbi:MAG TPA: YhjD/YihY/BrkB family envelope integrity protein [Verrucomicrobiae bacterium]|nr:YhjD/YihY/BrkB family envelope integrity protein [Verrucomicrobiae bacterium]
MAKQKQSPLALWQAKARQFLEGSLADGADTSPIVHRLRTAVNFITLVVRGFIQNRCPLRAAALCYTTLLALVPLLAVVFSVSKTFLRNASADLAPKVIDAIVAKVAPQLEYVPANTPSATTPLPAAGHVAVSAQARREVVNDVRTFIDNIDAGKLGAAGTILLALVAVRLLMTIEQTFNDIWGVAEGRSIWRKIVYYWTSITLGPLVVFGALAATGTAEYANVLNRLARTTAFHVVLLQLTPYVVLWLGFSLMYGLMPNTRVRLHAAVTGGLVAGTLWQLNSQLSAMYFSRVVSYSKIYGGLGVLPVFLLGLYFSWLIVLLGAQVSFAAQNVKLYMQQRITDRLDQTQRELLACRATLQVCNSFLRGLPPPTTETIANRLRAPLQAVNQLAHRLIEGGVLVEVARGDGGLLPAHPPESLTVADVLYVVRTNDGVWTNQPKHPSAEPVERILFELVSAARTAPANASFSDLASALE